MGAQNCAGARTIYATCHVKIQGTRRVHRSVNRRRRGDGTGVDAEGSFPRDWLPTYPSASRGKALIPIIPSIHGGRVPLRRHPACSGKRPFRASSSRNQNSKPQDGTEPYRVLYSRDAPNQAGFPPKAAGPWIRAGIYATHA